MAVVGTGSAGRRHLEALRSLSNVVPVAVPVRSGRMTTLRDEGFRTASNIKEAVGDGVTLAVIATNTDRHVSDGLLAMDAGCGLLVEKPLSVDAADANSLVKQSQLVGRSLNVACVLRFADSLNTFRSMLPEIGSVHAVQIECRSYLPEWRPGRAYKDSYSADSAQGGVLRDLIHEIDYAGWLFGWPKSLTARLRNMNRLGIASEESADLAWETASGCRVTVILDYLSRPPRRQMTAFLVRWGRCSGTG